MAYELRSAILQDDFNGLNKITIFYKWFSKYMLQLSYFKYVHNISYFQIKKRSSVNKHLCSYITKSLRKMCINDRLF